MTNFDDSHLIVRGSGRSWCLDFDDSLLDCIRKFVQQVFDFALQKIEAISPLLIVPFLRLFDICPS